MERKLGEVFEYDGVNLRVENAYIGCAGCYFLKIYGAAHCMAKDNIKKCRPSSRKDHNNVIFVEVNNNNNKDMEERNIKVDLNTAKEWFKGDNETLKKLALQAYKEGELKDNLPNSWEEFCIRNQVQTSEVYIGAYGVVFNYASPRNRDIEKTALPNSKSAEAHVALMQLERLRDCYRDGWKPDWENIELHKYVIYNFKNKIIFNTDIDGTSHFLAFPSIELCEKFYSNFKDLIETAKDLI